jgi:hypothetical protein
MRRANPRLTNQEIAGHEGSYHDVTFMKVVDVGIYQPCIGFGYGRKATQNQLFSLKGRQWKKRESAVQQGWGPPYWCVCSDFHDVLSLIFCEISSVFG